MCRDGDRLTQSNIRVKGEAREPGWGSDMLIATNFSNFAFPLVINVSYKPQEH